MYKKYTMTHFTLAVSKKVYLKHTFHHNTSLLMFVRKANIMKIRITAYVVDLIGSVSPLMVNLPSNV